MNVKRLMPVVVLGIITVGIWSAGVFAEEKSTIRDLSLSDALKTAIENNLDLKASALDLRNAELSLTETEANALQKPSPTSVLQAKTNLIVAQRNYDNAKSSLMVNLADAYFGLAKARNSIEIYENALKSSTDNLKVVQSKLKAGVAAPLDEIKAQADLITSENNLANANNSEQLTMLKLYQYMRLDSTQTLNLTTVPSYEPVKYDVEGDVRKALENRTEILQAKANIEIKGKEVELNTNDYTATITLEKSRLGLEDARLALEQAKDSIANEVRQNYINLCDAYNRIGSYDKSLASAKETLRVTQLRYKANMAVNSDVIDAQNSLTQNEANLAGAIFDYQIANYRYLKSIGTEYELK